jgi:hypothetical protein
LRLPQIASGAEAPPEAILWCDPGCEFRPVLPLLRGRLPNLLCLGAYDPATRTGPALWLRAAAGRHLPGLEWPEDEPAIIYLQLLYPDPAEAVPDDELEWAVRLALECRRRVKEQQKRIGSAEFRNTQFSYSMGLDGIEQFVSTPSCRARGVSAATCCRRARSSRSVRAGMTRPPASTASR